MKAAKVSFRLFITIFLTISFVFMFFPSNYQYNYVFSSYVESRHYLSEYPLAIVFYPFYGVAFITGILSSVFYKKKGIGLLDTFFALSASGVGLATGIIGIIDFSYSSLGEAFSITITSLCGTAILFTLIYGILCILIDRKKKAKKVRVVEEYVGNNKVVEEVQVEKEGTKDNKAIIESFGVLLKQGVISQEEYDNKIKEFLPKKVENNTFAYCPHCGKKLNGEKECPKCHKEVGGSSNNKTLRLLTWIFIIIGVISSAIAMPFSLFWTIPMKNKYKAMRDNHQKVSVGFKILNIIFVSQYAGIMMLCDDEKY